MAVVLSFRLCDFHSTGRYFVLISDQRRAHASGTPSGNLYTILCPSLICLVGVRLFEFE